jgi:hypothetical protein
LLLSGCNRTTSIEPGKFVEDWPSALRGELIKNSKCAVDAVNGKSAKQPWTVKRGEALVFTGWAFVDKGAPPDVYVQIVGPALTYTALTRSRLPRPDVNQYFKLNPDINTGFELSATQDIEPGEYKIEVLQSSDGSVAQCKTQLDLKVN